MYFGLCIGMHKPINQATQRGANQINNLDYHQPGDKQRRSQTTEEALSKAN